MKIPLIFTCLIVLNIPGLAQSTANKNIKAKVQNVKPLEKYMVKINSSKKLIKIRYYVPTNTFRLCVNDPYPPRPFPKGFGLSKLKCKCNPQAGEEINVMYIAPDVIRDFLRNESAYQSYGANHIIYIQGNEEMLLRINADSLNTNDEIINSYAVKAKNNIAASYKNIQFKPNSSQLTLTSYGVLDATSTDLKLKTDKQIELDGFTAAEGSAAHNARLAKDRANAVKTLLVNSGIDPKRIKVISYGETHPIADNSTEEGRLRNMRVEFIQK